MQERKIRINAVKTLRWDDAEWLWLKDFAKPLGLSRSGFIRAATMSLARAVMAGSTSYFVDVAIATPQNTRPNKSRSPIAKQGDGEFGGEGSRTTLDPEGITGPIAEQLGRQGGGDLTNGAKTKAKRAKSSRS